MARILLGVSGSVAAYKAAEIVRLATGAGHAVRVVQTPASLPFVGRATLEAITGAPVLVEELEPDPARGAFPGDPEPGHAAISHLELVRRCDVLAIAPASANTLAKLAAGLADNLLTSAALACAAPLVLAPAMNDRMWAHPATRANLETLRLRGAVIVEPAAGRLASRDEWGQGRLADPATIVAELERVIGAGPAAGKPPASAPRTLDGLRVTVTAGGTREPLDSVRYLGNRSSGRMGVALAAEAARLGAQVTLIAANLSVAPPERVRTVAVGTAAELEAVTRAEFEATDVLLMAAAVSDFRPAAVDPAKIDKSAHDRLVLALEPTTDVLGALASERRPGQVVVGFAAEHGGQGAARARDKLERKALDAIVLNDVARADIGFEVEHNEVTIITATGDRRVARATKSAVACAILDCVGALRKEDAQQR